MLALSAGNSPAAPTPAPGAATPGGAGAITFGATPPNQGRNAGMYVKPDDDAPSFGNPGNRRDRSEGFGIIGRGKGRDEGYGRSQRDKKPVDFHKPRESVQAFLDALEDKDVDLLSEATALRSPYEASSKHQKLFQSILDGSISEAQLNDIAENLDEYKIKGIGQVISTGRLSVLIQKTTDTGFHQRTVTVRKEKAGWKVLDIGGVIDFKLHPPKKKSSTSSSSSSSR
jgi:hypothetical protein